MNEDEALVVDGLGVHVVASVPVGLPVVLDRVEMVGNDQVHRCHRSAVGGRLRLLGGRAGGFGPRLVEGVQPAARYPPVQGVEGVVALGGVAFECGEDGVPVVVAEGDDAVPDWAFFVHGYSFTGCWGWLVAQPVRGLGVRGWARQPHRPDGQGRASITTAESPSARWPSAQWPSRVAEWASSGAESSPMWRPSPRSCSACEVSSGWLSSSTSSGPMWLLMCRRCRARR